jgi:hypothetical protein
MPFAGAQVTNQLESAVSFSLTRTSNSIISENTETSMLLLLCFFVYIHLFLLNRTVHHKVVNNILSRCMVITLGILAMQLTAQIQFTSVNGVRDTPIGSTAARIICLTSMLVFVSVLLQGVSMQYNFVNVFLYIFADAVQSLLQSDGAGMLTIFIAFVTCSCATRASTILRQLLPGLEVLMQAVTTANVNIVLDLVQDNCPEPLAHISMLIIVMYILEICKAVHADLAGTQGYAAYKISALLFNYILSYNINRQFLTILVGCGLLVLRHVSVSSVLDQLLYLLCINASIYLTNTALAYTQGAVAVFTMICLIISFETVKMLFE